MSNCEQVLRELKKRGYKALVWDLDDSILDTNSIISRQINLYIESVAKNTGISPEELWSNFKFLNDESFKVRSVQKTRWDWIAAQMGDSMGRRDVFVGELPILRKIYETRPPLIKGVLPIIAKMHNSGMKMGMVTHADDEWTKLKTIWIGRFFNNITTVDPALYKTKADWQRCCNNLRVDPTQCVAFGDSLRNDIEPAGSLGMDGILLPSVWHLYATGVMPRRAVQVEHVTQVFEGIEKLLEMDL